LVIIENFFTFGLELEYLGIVLLSFISSVIVFIPIPYFPVLMTAALDKNLDPTLIAFFSAIGAVAGKMIIFCGSYYGRKIIFNEYTKKSTLPLQKLLRRYGWIGAFIAAATPIPDDIVYIPLGLAKYNPLKFASALFAGKFVLSEITVVVGVYFGRPLIEFLIVKTSDPKSLISIAGITIAIIVITIYYFIKTDWEKIIGKWFPWTLEEDKSSDNKDEQEKSGMKK
jgi:membrane protein DedA with SNARE-associated domain